MSPQVLAASVGEARAGAAQSVPDGHGCSGGGQERWEPESEWAPDSLRAGESAQGPSPSPGGAAAAGRRGQSDGEITLPVLWSGMAS